MFLGKKDGRSWNCAEGDIQLRQGDENMEYSAKELRPLLRELKLEQSDIAEELPRNLHTNNQERALRALSWVAAAQQQQQDDLRLICAWIAFNAMYAVPPTQTADSTSPLYDGNEQIDTFIGKITKADKDGVLLNALQSEQNDNLLKLINNQYLYSKYWKSYGREFNMEKFNADNEKIKDDLSRGDDAAVLVEVMRRIRVLRNQVMHGEAGFGDYYNRTQIGAGADFMLHLTERMLGVMMRSMHSSDAKFRWGSIVDPPQGPKPDAPTPKARGLRN